MSTPGSATARPSTTTTATTTTASYRQYSRANSSSTENLPPKTLARVAREVRDLHKNPPEGVRLVVDASTGMPNNLGELMAELQGPVGTPYEGKFFVLKLVFNHDFPSAPPRGFFLTKLYHPNVDMTSGAICVNTLKKDWTTATTLGHVLSVIRCLLIVPFPESSLNDEAGRLFMESYDEYAKRARLMADVHGRRVEPAVFATDATTDVAATAEQQQLQLQQQRQLEESSKSVKVRGVLKSSSDTTNNTATMAANASAGSSSSSSSSTTKKTKAPLNTKLGKKKSLKRL